MSNNYEAWLDEVRSALRAVNMSLDQWQKIWRFDFASEYRAGADPKHTAHKANRFWWHEQNKSLEQNCRLTPDCWLPRGHQGECEQV